MGSRPQTLYGIADSPVGLAAWILDHDVDSYEMIARVFDGETEGLTRDDILDNITLYWLTNTAISSARLYWENHGGLLRPEGRQHPGRRQRLPTEIYTAPKSWAEQAYPKLIHYNTLPKGGHFAAWEQPAFFVSELRAGFKPLRQEIYASGRAPLSSRGVDRARSPGPAASKPCNAPVTEGDRHER